MGQDFWEATAAVREQIEQALRHWLERMAGDAPVQLREAMAYSLLAPGKRLRPLLAVLFGQLADGDGTAALPAACAVEMIHAYSLIHDDLPAMDDDDYRRGRPTCHRVYGEAIAILAGDALQCAAFAVLAGGYPPPVATVMIQELAAAAGAAGMVGGQVLDLLSENATLGPRPVDAGTAASTPQSMDAGTVAGTAQKVGAGTAVGTPRMGQQGLESLLTELHQRKTGALIRAAVRLGLYSGGLRPVDHSHPLWNAADTYAAALGLLFQVTDDLLDVEGSREKTGKQTQKDAARGKLTFPQLYGMAETRRRAIELAHAARRAAEQLGSRLLGELVEYVVTRER